MKKENYTLKSLMLIVMIALMSNLSFAQSTTVTQDGVIYTLNGDGASYSITGYDSSVTDVVIQSAIGGLPITYWASAAFQNAAIKTLKIEGTDNTLNIVGTAFQGCKNLTDVTLSGNIIFSDKATFKDCSSLKNVTFANNTVLTTLNQQLFRNCIALKEIDLTPLQNLGIIDDNAFVGCTSLAKVTLPSPSKITTIGASAFNSNAITSFVIPGTVTTMKNSAFKGCPNLSSVTFESNDNDLNINAWTFDSCPALKSIDLSTLKGLTTLHGNFQKSGLESIILPESLSTLAGSTFNGCASLKDINLPESLTAIGATDFQGCTSLNILRVPKNVVSVGDKAFYNGPSIIVIEKEGGEWDATILSSAFGSAQVYAYKTVTGIPSDVTVTKVAPMQMNASGKTTYFSNTAVRMPAGFSGSAIKAVNGDKVDTDFSNYPAGSIVPSSTGILLQADAPQEGTYYCKIEPLDETASPTDNLLKGSEESETTTGGDKYYKLSSDGSNSAAFVYGEAEGVAFTNEANNAYLALTDAQANGIDRFEINIVSGINDISLDPINNVYYNLSGMRLEQRPALPGIYIINGKKCIIK